MVWIGVVLLNSFNPNLAHPLESLLGIHTDLFYLVIFLPAGIYLLRSFREVNILFTLLCVFTLFPTIIGTAGLVIKLIASLSLLDRCAWH